MKRLALALGFFVFGAGDASAQNGDGAYGRWQHGLVVQLGAGVALGGDGGLGNYAFDGALRARILDAAGPSVGIIAGEGGPLVLAGVELRPLWPALFLLDMSTGRRWVDRFIQSIGVELSAVFAPTVERSGTGFAYAFHVELPLVYGREGAFDGLRLRAAVRRIVGGAFVNGPSLQRSWTAVISLTLDLGAAFAPAYAEPAGYLPR